MPWMSPAESLRNLTPSSTADESATDAAVGTVDVDQIEHGQAAVGSTPGAAPAVTGATSPAATKATSASSAPASRLGRAPVVLTRAIAGAGMQQGSRPRPGVIHAVQGLLGLPAPNRSGVRG